MVAGRGRYEIDHYCVLFGTIKPKITFEKAVALAFSINLSTQLFMLIVLWSLVLRQFRASGIILLRENDEEDYNFYLVNSAD